VSYPAAKRQTDKHLSKHYLAESGEAHSSISQQCISGVKGRGQSHAGAAGEGAQNSLNKMFYDQKTEFDMVF